MQRVFNWIRCTGRKATAETKQLHGMYAERNMMEDITMTIYFIKSENGKTLCGPFTKVEDAEYALENYTDTFWYGNCSIIKKEI